MKTSFGLRTRSRSGLTLIEVLVVLAILGVLVGLFLPAVQKVRETVASTQCKNNLKQIGLAFQTHHDTLGYFPAGGWEWWTPPNYINGSPAVGVQQQGGWGFQVLPYLEGDNAWKNGAVVAIGAIQKVFFCPSRRNPQTLTFQDEYTPPLTLTTDITHALCDYAASNLEGTGVVQQYYPTRFAEITDGTSSTLLVGDKRLNLQDLGQNQPDDNEGYTVGWDEDTVRYTDRTPMPDYRASNGAGQQRFGSSHPSRFNTVFADGSVHSLSYDIDATVFRYLGNRSDGQVIADAF
jgi:prepilin-type N-terminal cleavage/methylation domain-containing protein/prepilin-type processing-associated H-X9-DG protein